MSTRQRTRWSTRQDAAERDARVRLVGDGLRGTAPKLDVLSAFTGTHPSDLSRWTRGQRDGGPLGYCVDAIVEAVRSPKGSPGAIIAALIEVAVEAAAELDVETLEDRIRAACRSETEAEGPENLSEFDMIASLGSPSFAAMSRAYLDASRGEVAPQLEAIIHVSALRRRLGVGS